MRQTASGADVAVRYIGPVDCTEVAAEITRDLKTLGVDSPEITVVPVERLAANRDPVWFPEPDRFDVGRSDNGHLAFAWGSHFCLGARLARLEARLVFTGLHQRFTRLDLADEPVRRPGLALRGLESLSLRLTPR